MSGHEYMKQKRKAHGLSLRKLAELSGVSYVNIKMIEDGKRMPSIDVTLRLLQALGIPTKDYLSTIGYKEPKKGKVVAVQGIEPRTLRI